MATPMEHDDDERASWLSRWLPGVAQLAHYPRDAWRHDLVAGAAACIVMIPSVLAYAELVGVGPERGLYAALGAMAAFALFTSSRAVITGPDTTIALLAGAVIAPLAQANPAQTAALAAALAMITGVLLVLAGQLRLGGVADLMSRPVLVGYANGAALILIGSQLPPLLGIVLERDAFFLRVYDALRLASTSHRPTVWLGLALIALIVVIQRFAPRIPAALVACAVAGIAVAALNLAAGGVAMLKPIAGGLPMPVLPDVSFEMLQRLVPGALALAFLIFAEGVLLAQMLATKRKETVDADAELRALGVANFAAGVFNGFNVGASGSRSFTADAAGARTQLTQWVTIALLVAFMFWLSPVIALVPRVALAAILIAAAVGLLDLVGVRRLWRMDRRSVALSLAVTLGVLIAGVLPGVLLGIVLGLARTLIDLARPGDAVLRRHTPEGRYHDLDEDEPGVAAPGVIVYRLYAPLVFANARYVGERLRELVRDAEPPAKLLVLDMQAVTYVDVTAAEILRELYDELEAEGIDVRIARANRPLREQLLHWFGDHHLGHERFFPAASAAVDDWLAGKAARAV
jgi:SulP family sulfate permease